MSQRKHEFTLQGDAATCDRLGFVVTEGGNAELLRPDSQYSETAYPLTYDELEELHRFLGEMLNVVRSDGVEDTTEPKLRKKP